MKKITVAILLLFPCFAFAAPFTKDSFIATDATATSTFGGNFAVNGNVSFNLGDGLLSIVNGLLTTASVQSPLTFANNVLGCPLATSTQNGCLSASDWIRFDAAASGGGSADPAGSNKEIQFNDNGIFGASSKFVFDTTTGFLGVGTSTQYRPNQRWEFMSETANANGTTFVHTNYNDGFAPIAAFQARTARGTAASPSAVLANDGIGVLAFNGFDGTVFPASAPTLIRGFASENWSGNTWGSGLQFFTTANGGTTRTEKMRIAANGNIGIGTTSPFAKLSVIGGGFFSDLVIENDLTVGSDMSIAGHVVLQRAAEENTQSCVSVNPDDGELVWNGGWPCLFGERSTPQATTPIAYWKGQHHLSSDDNAALLWDSVNKRLAVGTSSPQFALDVFSAATTTIRMDGSSSSRGGCIVMKDSDGNGYSYITVNDGVLSASTIPCN